VKALLINTNRERSPQPVIPLGLCLVASALKAGSFQPRLLDLAFSRHPVRDIARAVREWRPDAVCMSVRNLDNGEYLHPRGYIREVAEVAVASRHHFPPPLIIGGSAVSIAPAQLLARLGADFAVVGDGEVALPELLTRIADEQPATGIAGVYCSNDALLPAPARVEDLDSLPAPEAGRWLNLARYFGCGSPMPLQSKRGCVFECIYCTYRQIEGAKYRLRAPDSVIAEVEEALVRWGARRFEFVDATFNHPPDHALALCDAIARRHLRVDFHTMGLNPGAASRELLLAMKAARFDSAVCAAESGSARMLETLRKGFGVDDLAHTAAWAREAGLPLLWSFMFGGPGESERTVRETLSFIERAVGPQDRVLCTVGLRVYPGTELARVAREDNALELQADLAEPAFYFSRGVCVERVVELIERSPRRSQMIYLETLQRPLVRWVLRAQAALRLRGPSWSGVPLYNRLTQWSRPRRPAPRADAPHHQQQSSHRTP
jgi:hypothetical protein